MPSTFGQEDGSYFDDLPTFHDPWSEQALRSCYPDWKDKAVQWDAKFNNVPFCVQTDSRSGGRRVHVHEFPSRENWANEDLGRLRQQVDVQGYVYGPEHDRWAEKLFNACTSPSISMLYLPMRVPLQARCLTVESTFNADQLGRIDFTMRFSLETGDPLGETRPGGQSQVQLEQKVMNGAQSLMSESRTVFESQFTGAQSSPGRREAGATMQRVATALRTAGKQARLTAVPATQLAFAAQTIDRNAVDLSASQRSETSRLTSTTYVKSQRPPKVPSSAALAGAPAGVSLRTSTDQVLGAQGGKDEGFGGLLSKAMKYLTDNPPAPADLIQALYALTLLKSVALIKWRAPVVNAQSVIEELALSEAVAAYTRRLSIAQSALASIKVAPEYQPDITNVRKRMLKAIDAEIALLAATPHGDAALQAARLLRAAVVDHIAYWSQGGALTEIKASPLNKPITTAVADIYPDEDPSTSERDRQLIKLNGIRHPFFAPSTLSALK
jgi:prophage DNA circulation protein